VTPRFRSIRLIPSTFASQLLLLFVVALLVPVLFIGTLIRSDLDGAERAASRLAVRQARHAATEIEAAYARDRELATILAGLPGFWNGSDEDRDQILTAFSNPYPSLNGLAYFTDNFEQHGKAFFEPGSERPSMAIRAYAAEAIATGQPAFADEVVAGRISGRQLLSLVIPFRELPAGRQGYLSASFRADHLPSLWDLRALPDDSSVLLVDGRSGRVLGGTLNSPFVPNSVIDGSMLDLLRSESTSFRRSGGDGELLVSKDPVEGTPWVVFRANADEQKPGSDLRPGPATQSAATGYGGLHGHSATSILAANAGPSGRSPTGCRAVVARQLGVPHHATGCG
jgi:hypothetical protein